MYRCRHEKGEDPYASGNENRRRNRDRLNDDIERRNFLRRLGREGHGPPGLPPFGLGAYASSGPPRPPGYLGCSRPWSPRFYPSPNDDDFDSDYYDSPSPWYSPRPPPYYGTSPVSTRALCSQFLGSGRRGRRGGRSHRQYHDDDDEDDYIYGYSSIPLFLRRSRRY
ncbi:hypothetical protein OPT61_g1622 [Boeremia exigua]|uniref:Uncharacterized protein n=1 Tax=Boeremia exigua TaxID=749465 RepID=A0ACC2IPR5_9PLEO|nr:hypothetical protein OPT61_g1622 [Boeremia exigua]